MDNQKLTNNKVDRDSTRDQNFHGRKITNAGEPTAKGDLTTKNYVDNALATMTAALKKAGVNI